MEKEKVWKSIKSKVNSKSRLSKHVNKLASIYSWTDLMLSSIYRGVFQPPWAGLVYFADPQSMDCRIGLLNRLLSVYIILIYLSWFYWQSFQRPRLVRDTDSTFYLQWNFIALFDLEASRLPTRWRNYVCKFFSRNFRTKKTRSSFSIIIRIYKGEDYEFLAVAVRDFWQLNYSQQVALISWMSHENGSIYWLLFFESSCSMFSL